jgi:hypothetical protein
MASSVLNSDDGVISGTAGLKSSGGDDGVLNIQNNGTTAVTVNASGNVGIGTTSPGSKLTLDGTIQIGAAGSAADVGITKIATRNIRFDSAPSTGTGITVNVGTDANQNSTFIVNGNAGIGTTSPSSRLHVASASDPTITLQSTTESTMTLIAGGNGQIRSTTALDAYTNGALRFRIDTSGNIFTSGNYTVSYPGESNTTTGIFLESAGKLGVSRDNTNPFYVNRNTSDGTLISMRTGGNEQGTISVSGGTVSYNAFAGSHWSQLSDGSKPDILRGTVMESINELVQWPNEPITERLPKCKISDTAGSKKVYGVFMDWDNDWTATNDMYVTAIGAFVCRVNKDAVVQQGDLLESNGDGTARVQADDVIRSSTIGKVTSTEKTHEYDDGSYCVPTVLYCG